MLKDREDGEEGKAVRRREIERFGTSDGIHVEG